MNTNLKQLQQYKGSKKEFAFLKPVTEYIAEHYGEIQGDLSISNMQEILEEIQGINTEYNEVFVYYSTPETIYFFSKYGLHLYKKETDKEGVDNTLFNCSRSVKDVSISNLYYIADFNLYEEYLEEQRQERVKESIQYHLDVAKKRQEEEDKLQIKIVEDKRLRAKYGLKLNEDTNKAKALETILESTDKAAQYKAFSELQDSGIDENYIREIANEEANDVYSDRIHW